MVRSEHISSLLLCFEYEHELVIAGALAGYMIIISNHSKPEKGAGALAKSFIRVLN